MAFIPLGETANAGLVMSGYGKPYLKRASYAKGYNPEHLKAYQAAFSTASSSGIFTGTRLASCLSSQFSIIPLCKLTSI